MAGILLLLAMIGAIALTIDVDARISFIKSQQAYRLQKMLLFEVLAKINMIKKNKLKNKFKW